jgi:hypothetical protein
MSRHADYYLKTKQDPDKLTALRARRAKNQRERRAKLNPRSQQETKGIVRDALAFCEEAVVSSPVVSNVGGMHAASQTQWDISLTPEQITNAWREVWGAS